MQDPKAQKLTGKDDAILIACVSEREAILGSGRPLQPGFAYLLCFGKPFSRLVLRSIVFYCHLLPGPRKRYEIGILIPDVDAGRKLSDMDIVSPQPLELLGYPKLLGAVGENDPALGESGFSAMPRASSSRSPLRDGPTERSEVLMESPADRVEDPSRRYFDLWIMPPARDA